VGKLIIQIAIGFTTAKFDFIFTDEAEQPEMGRRQLVDVTHKCALLISGNRRIAGRCQDGAPKETYLLFSVSPNGCLSCLKQSTNKNIIRSQRGEIDHVAILKRAELVGNGFDPSLQLSLIRRDY